jgi:Class II flagellar assembly regulator
LEINRTRIETSAVKRADRTTRSGGKGFATIELGEASASTGLTGGGPIAAVETLLALQGIEDTPDQRSRGIAHADDLLHLLDEVRDGLLSGGIPRRTLSRMAHAIAKRRESFADEKLQSVLDEIDLRARVELAKLEMSDRPLI